jgi:hypothetical protein
MRGRGKLFAVVDGEGGVPKPNFKILWEGRVPEWNWEPPGWGTVDERSKGLERHRFGFVLVIKFPCFHLFRLDNQYRLP